MDSLELLEFQTDLFGYAVVKSVTRLLIPGPPAFLVHTLKKLGVAWGQGYIKSVSID